MNFTDFPLSRRESHVNSSSLNNMPLSEENSVSLNTLQKVNSKTNSKIKSPMLVPKQSPNKDWLDKVKQIHQNFSFSTEPPEVKPKAEEQQISLGGISH